MANFTINIGEQNINENNILGENVSKGDLLYLSTDGKYYKANASSKPTSTTELRLAETSGLINEEISLLAFGNFEFDLPTLVSGTKYYVSITSGQITSTLYTNTNNIVRYIGTAYSSTILIFNPDQTYISDNGFRVNDIPIKSSLQAHTHLESDISDLDKYTQAEVDLKLQSKDGYDTGLIAHGILSANIINNANFDISIGYGVKNEWDGTASEPKIELFEFGPFSDIPLQFLGQSPVTYVAIDYDITTKTSTVFQQATPFTDEQRRDLVILGLLVHSNNANIEVINNISAPISNISNQVHDLYEAIGALNLRGNTYSANGSNLNINKSAGTIFKLGINYFNNFKKPHSLNILEDSFLTFRYRLSDSTEFSDTNVINPNLYESSPGVTSNVPPNKWTIQRITMFQSGITRVQYGQDIYDTRGDAIIGIDGEQFTTEANIAENGILRCYLIVKEGTTNLSSLTQAEFIEVGKFGNVSGSQGSALTYANIISALGFTPENLANKVINFSNPTNNNYPSTLAVVNYVASQVLSFYEHIQSTPATTWNISHNLGKKPSVTIQDNFGNDVEGSVVYVNNNNLTINFIFAVEGTAYLN